MKIVIATEEGEIHEFEVDSQMEIENLKALIEAELNVHPNAQTLFFNGNELKESKKAIGDYGIVNHDLVILKKNKPLFQRPVLSLDDPHSLELQRKIEEEIRMKNVLSNMETALEYYPESFAIVHPLFIQTEVNGVPVKACVDSGAQSTIMSPSCAERCGLKRLLDTRFQSIAHGVGIAKVIGRIHSAQIKVGDIFLACSFGVMELRIDILFGLDMLKRHQACIDLKQDCLIINDRKIPFLPEHELPSSSRLDPANSGSSSEPSFPEQDIRTLMDLGLSRDQAIHALLSTSGNVDLAASSLFN